MIVEVLIEKGSVRQILLHCYFSVYSVLSIFMKRERQLHVSSGSGLEVGVRQIRLPASLTGKERHGPTGGSVCEK
jgi:hypothetical protein